MRYRPKAGDRVWALEKRRNLTGLELAMDRYELLLGRLRRLRRLEAHEKWCT